MKQIEQYAICLDENYDDGIKQLASLVADKKVVGVGESTHGTHEFFQLKADLAWELIVNHGFRTFALEDEAAKCRLIDDFIQTGEGELDKLIESLYVVWRTQEVKNLILRLKELAETYDVCFMGVDVEDSELKEKPGKPMFEERDKLMANNIIKAAHQSKTFVWAHNSHISRLHLDVHNTGRYLGKYLDEKYASIGQFFGRGTFNTKVIPKDKEVAVEDFKLIPLSVVEVPSPKNGFLEEVLDKAECQSYFIDLSNSNKVDVLGAEYKCRAFGAATRVENIDKYPMSVHAYSYYDVLVYFKYARHAEILKS